MTILAYIETKSPQKIRILLKDLSKPYTTFLNRSGVVAKGRPFELLLPQSPEKLAIYIFNEKNGNITNDNSFKVKKFEIARLRTWEIWMSDKTKEFIKFAQQFCETAGILQPGVYMSDKGTFQIKYTNDIRSEGRVLSTPARISNINGIMEVAKRQFIKYTIPMRMAILFHEYSHFNLNKHKRSEVQSDLNGAYYYLGLGYPRTEWFRAWLAVFDNADTIQNEQRYQIMKDYVRRFERGEFAKPRSKPLLEAA